MDTKTVATTSATAAKHKTTPIAGTLTAVPNYPKKLTIYQLLGSKYWWVRYYVDGKTIRRSTKEQDKNKALKFAKNFYEDLIIRQRQGLAISKRGTFESVAAMYLKSHAAQFARGEVTKITHDNTEYRLFGTVIPFFRDYEVSAVTYEVLEEFLQQLSQRKPKLSGETINAYMKLAKRVLFEAQQRGMLPYLPQFPRIKKRPQPRDSFSVTEYRALWSRARALSGKSFNVCKVALRKGHKETTQYIDGDQSRKGRLIRRVLMTDDLYQLIVFMTNSFIRPTDIKNLQHKHVEVVRNDRTYLLLRLPASKGHKDPIVTMEKAVEVYERLRESHTKQYGKRSGDDYVFLPQYTKRDYALKQFQRQFDVLLHLTNMRRGATGEERSLYSLRHTCIMFRLRYGEKMDLITIARNARTSPEMINLYYASKLKGEDNIDMLQSRRKRTKRVGPA